MLEGQAIRLTSTLRIKNKRANSSESPELRYAFLGCEKPNDFIRNHCAFPATPYPPYAALERRNLVKLRHSCKLFEQNRVNIILALVLSMKSWRYV
jgi:hypothetical protein